MDRFISKIYEFVEYLLKKITSSVDEGKITKYNFIFLLWGFLTLLELLYVFLDMKYRPIGEIFAYISPDIVTRSDPKSLYSIVESSKTSQNISMLLMICFLLMSFYSTLLFLYFLIKVYKNYFKQ
jgi:hypothetical protein